MLLGDLADSMHSLGDRLSRAANLYDELDRAAADAFRPFLDALGQGRQAW
jgi:hypothetical protein